jgi:hypothetical protein
MLARNYEWFANYGLRKKAAFYSINNGYDVRKPQERITKQERGRFARKMAAKMAALRLILLEPHKIVATDWLTLTCLP